MRLLGLFLLAGAATTLDGTLSKSDKTKKRPTAVPNAREPSLGRAAEKFEEAATGFEEILASHDRLEFGQEKQFPHQILGYVTPWNGHGYDLAKWVARKMTHLTPVWFQITPTAGSPDQHPTCTIAGTHDMDQGWVKDVRSNNSAVNFLPRFIFEKWSGVQLRSLFTYEDQQNECIDVLVHFLNRNKFQGAVIELWVSVMSMSQGLAANDLIGFLTNMGEVFKGEALQLVLPVPPPIGGNRERSLMFTAEHFEALEDYVDLFQVMTYDYPDNRAGPVAPLKWVRECMEALLLKNPTRRSKLLLGLNFYGYDYSSKAEPVVGRQFLELLRTHKPKLEWDTGAAEHFIRFEKHVVYYPSLGSVEARVRLARDLGVGLAIWEMGQGLDYFYNLL